MSEVEEIREILNNSMNEELNEESNETMEAADEEVIEAEETELEETEEVAEEVAEFLFEEATVKDLAEQIEVDPSELYKLKISLSETGEAIPLGEAKDQFQTLSREKANLERQLQEQQQVPQFSAQMQQAQAEMMMLQHQYNSVNWEEEKQLDPGAAALRMQEMAMAYNAAQNKVREVQQYEQQQQAQRLMQEKQALMELVPEWRDEAKLAEGQAAIRQVLRAKGISDAKINSISDADTMSILKEYAELKLQQAEARETEKVVRKGPKPLRSKGKFATKTQVNRDKAVQAAKQNPNKQTEFAAVKEIFRSAQ